MTVNLLLMFALCAAVGVLSSLIGVGGGILLVPIFTLLFEIPLLEALALSLCCVIATSVTSTTRYLPDGLTDVKLALYLEIPTITASYLGGMLAAVVHAHVIMVIFSIVLTITAISMFIPRSEVDADGRPPRGNFPIAAGASLVAGSVVGLLGIGGGIVKVPILQFFMRKTIKQAVTTSTLMLGITAAVGILPYISRGNLLYGYVPFTALGTIAGAYLGASVFHRIESLHIKLLFAGVLCYTAVNMILKVFR